MKQKSISMIEKTIVRDALISVANKYHNPKYYRNIIDRSRVKLISKLLYLLQNQGKQFEALSILDVGCGNCDLLLFFMNLGVKKLAGVNLFPLSSDLFHSEEAIAELFGKESGRINYIECDVDKYPLPFHDETFDIVLLIDVLEHLYDPGFALKEIARVIKRGGYICLRTPNCANLKNRLRLLLGKSLYHELKGWIFDHRFHVPKTGEKKFQGHIREYTVEELNRLLGYFGFRLSHIRTHPAEHYPQHRNLLKIYNILERLYPRFAYTISIIAIRT